MTKKLDPKEKVKRLKERRKTAKLLKATDHIPPVIKFSSEPLPEVLLEPIPENVDIDEDREVVQNKCNPSQNSGGFLLGMLVATTIAVILIAIIKIFKWI